MGIFNFLLQSLTFSKGIYFHSIHQYDILPNDLKEDTPKAFGELNNNIVISRGKGLVLDTQHPLPERGCKRGCTEGVKNDG